MRRGSISSELLVCGGGVRRKLLLPLLARCLETIDVCTGCKFVFMSGFSLRLCLFLSREKLLCSVAVVC